MSYGTEEVIPMLDGTKTSKNQTFGLAAFMVLCVALTSFMAGHASNSAATASTVGWSRGESCSRWRSDLNSYCDSDTFNCFIDVWYRGGEGPVSKCMESNTDSNCKWGYDIMTETCDY